MEFRNERAFTDATIDLFRMNGWKVHHARGNQYRLVQGHRGLPDIVAVREGRLLFAELKHGNGQTSTDQENWLYELKKVPGAEVFLWRERDWEDILRVARR